MRIIVDADSCSKIRQIEEIAEEKGLPVMLFCDTAHQLYSDYSKIKKVAPGRDASDMQIYNECKIGDIVITQDYGLASLVLAKGALVMHPSGAIYSKETIDTLLMSRYLNQIDPNIRHRKKKRRSVQKKYDFQKSLLQMINPAKTKKTAFA